MAPRSLPRFAIGDRLGPRYVVTGFLGKGGMGAVYRARDVVLDEEVALKIIRGDDESLLEEVRLAQQVTHRNVCRTYDLESIDGHHVVKMEYIDGETLANRLARTGPLPIAQAIEVARAIADGLAAAHARGIVHRDLKPANVMLAADRVVLMDFGLAQHEGATDLAGTPGYMSPEQLAGEAIDARSDLFALGCVMFEMLTGTPAFGMGELAEVIVRMSTLPDVRACRRDVPRWLTTVVRALLAIDPSARARGLTLLARRAPSPKLAIIATLLLTMVGMASWISSVPSWEPIVRDLPAYDENAAEPSFSPAGNSYVFSSDRGHRDLWSVYVVGAPGAEPRQVSPANTLCVGARWTRDARAIIMSCLGDHGRRLVRHALDGRPDRDLGPGWSVDDCGDQLAVIVSRPAGAALVLRDRNGHDTEVVELPAISMVRCDRSGQRMVTVTGPIGHPGFGGDLLVVDRQRNATRLTHTQDVIDATFAPDGASILFSMQQGATSSVFEIGSSGGEIHAVTPHEQYAMMPDVSADGRSVIFDRDRTSIPLLELTARGSVQQTFRFERLSHIVAAPNGRVLLATSQAPSGMSIVMIGLADFSERILTAGEALYVNRDDGVVFRAPDDPRMLQTISLRGGPITTLATLPAPIVDAADGPDGRHVELDRSGRSEAWLVSSSGHVSPEGVAGLVIPARLGGWRVVRTADGVEVTLRFVPPGRPLSAPAFERSAAWGEPVWVDDHVFAYCELKVCHRLDVTTGRDLATTAIDPPGARPITLGSDGSRWFTTSYVGQVSRHVITNFAERRWATAAASR